MKRSTSLFILFIIVSIGISINACNKSKKCNENNISSASNDSHNSGQNCLQCHISTGKGEGCFNVAGSTYDSTLVNHLSAGQIKLYTQPNGGGSLKYTIEIDQSGNFYTTENVDVNGLYPALVDSKGKSSYMSSSISSGACNSCHGNSTSRISN